MKTYSIYTRVSTTRQGESGLGSSSQENICREYINREGGSVDAVFSDVESGRSRTRKGLWTAIDHCKETGSTLVIAKLDRLARDVEFTFKILNTGVNIHFVDMPAVNTVILGVFASVAQYERELISVRTKAALDAKKKRDGSWSHLYGKNTGTTRQESVAKANEASCRSKQETAKANTNNERFYRYILNYESKNGRIDRHTDIEAIVRELNALGFKTATGMLFDCNRFRAMHKKVRTLYAMS